MKKKSNRRKFINKSLVTLSGASLLTSCISNVDEKESKDININFNKKYNWKMVTTWAPNMPVLGEGVTFSRIGLIRCQEVDLT
jgi:TRAP-type mannitol/chloroaromatic compound transport system substrate-binding protein